MNIMRIQVIILIKFIIRYNHYKIMFIPIIMNVTKIKI